MHINKAQCTHGLRGFSIEAPLVAAAAKGNLCKRRLHALPSYPLACPPPNIFRPTRRHTLTHSHDDIASPLLFCPKSAKSHLLSSSICVCSIVYFACFVCTYMLAAVYRKYKGYARRGQVN